MSDKHKSPLWFSLLVAGIVLGGGVLYFAGIGKGRYQLFSSTKKGYYRVETVNLSNAFLTYVNGDATYIYLTGVTAPKISTGLNLDKHQCGAEATRLTLQRLIGQKDVRLEGDVQITDQPNAKSLYRYVYDQQELLINVEMIKRGYGFVDESLAFIKKDEFRQYQQTAQDNKLGLWQQCEIQKIGEQYSVR